MICRECGCELEPDEIALTKKLINRGSTEFLCFSCLEKHFELTHEQALALVEKYKKMGCQLFA